MVGPRRQHVLPSRLVLLALACASCTCRDPVLTQLQDALRVPSGVDCGRVRLGQEAVVEASIDNVGQAPVTGVTWATDAPFAIDAPSTLPPGTSTIQVRCQPAAAGRVNGLLTLTAHGEQVPIGLSLEGVKTPDCPSPGACQASTWSDALSRCVDAPLPDGTGCRLDDVCLVNATCEAGRCTGQPDPCDDHDACTLDTCAPGAGCQHQPKRCPGDDVCQVGTCDPSVGCGLGPAPDGQPCGPQRTCVAAQICLAGQCEVRTPPEGALCAEQSPCQAAGHCVDQQCQQPAPGTLRASWAAGLRDAGVPSAWSDLLLTPKGEVTVSSYFMATPVFGLNLATPVQLQAGNARRCIAWRGGLVCADYPASLTAAVSLIEPATGATVWSYSAALTDLPGFAGPSVQVFLGRLAVLSDDTLLALFESRTNNPDGSDPRCRRFGMVVLDSSGQRVASAVIEHPIFEACTHPHSYGLAVDAAGQLYLGFAPSGVDNPATAIDGTVLLSYAPSLQLRWSAAVPGLVGGELAVARGKLFHERSTTVWSTATGQPVGVLPIPFGFGVVSSTAVLPAPLLGSSTAVAVDADSLTPRWTQPLAGAAGGAVHLATVETSFGPRTALLAFTGPDDARQLTATDTSTGLALFACPIELPERPVQSALTRGQLSVMSGPSPTDTGASECDRCDPRWAKTRNTFRTFLLPGLSPAQAPWPGAWGGIGHSHREDEVP